MDAAADSSDQNASQNDPQSTTVTVLVGLLSAVAAVVLVMSVIAALYRVWLKPRYQQAPQADAETGPEPVDHLRYGVTETSGQHDGQLVTNNT
jgi:hypothetical protein